MAEFLKVAELSDLKPGSCTAVEAGGKTIVLCNVDGALYAFDNACIHRGGPLSEGEIAGDVVTCPWHGWQYDVRTGEKCGDRSKKIATCLVKVEGDGVMVAL